jgi:signal transduction histidine kinase
VQSEVVLELMTGCPGNRTVEPMLLDRGVADPGHREAMPRRWLPDAVLALVVGAAQVAATSAMAAHRSLSVSASGYALLGAGAAVLVARRRFPVLVLAATYVTTFAYRATDNPSGAVWLSVIVAFGTAIYLRSRVAAIAFLVAGYVGFLWGPWVAGRRQNTPSATFALGLGVGLLLLLAGAEGIRLRRQRAAAVAHGRAQEAMRRAGEQRLRIARDLHDVVAHSIAVISVQSNTALHLMDRQPDQARRALSTINAVSRQALAELRHAVGVLRQADEDAPRAPAPTLARLKDLVARATEAGLTVQVHEHGDRLELPTEVDVAAYRIVQEALTNTARHSGCSAAVVRIGYEPQRLRVQVDDDGRGTPSTPSIGGGAGIVGMTERVEALGGELHAGPRTDGGFRVSAVLPAHRSEG